MESLLGMYRQFLSISRSNKGVWMLSESNLFKMTGLLGKKCCFVF